MQQIEYKLNGYSFRDYAEIGIGVHNLYRYAKKVEDENALLNRAFEFKYGSAKDKYHQFQEYYYKKLRAIKKLGRNQRHDLLVNLKIDYYKSAEMFNLSKRRIDYIWTDMTLGVI